MLAGRIGLGCWALLSRKIQKRRGSRMLFPQPEQVSPLRHLTGFGHDWGATRAKAIVGLAAAVMADRRLFDPHRDLPEAVARLRELPGIGEWTAQYIAMRALGESDAFLAGDVGIQRSLHRDGRRPSSRELLARSNSAAMAVRMPCCICGWADADAEGTKTSLKEKRHAVTA